MEKILGFVITWRLLSVCGIAGYLNLSGAELDPREPHLAEMCRSIHHRGPDERGMKYIGPAALGMTRLSIIDLSSGQQPIANEDNNVWIVFNGEIYNFQELRERCLSQGHTFRTKSDTEVIVHLYEQYGVDCVQYLDGMFAFAIWDIAKQRLFIARDRMGEKPLHWAIFDNTFFYGSEIKTILSHPNAKRQLNPIAMQEYLAMESVPAPSTMFEGIHKLPPASYMLIEGGQVKVERYWSPDVNQIKISEQEASERLFELLDRSVKLRMISDVPLGVFLSGGIDSSGVTALAARHSSQPIKTFSIGFPDQSFDESDYAEQVSKHVGTEHHKAIFTPELALSMMEELWTVLDEPIADASILPTYFLSKMTRKNVTVALSGEGGDELFGGYPTYFAHRLAAIWRAIPAPLRQGVFAPIINSLPVSLNNLSFDYKLKRFISSAEEETMVRHLRWMGSIPIAQHSGLIKRSAFDTVGGAPYQSHDDLVAKLTETRWLMQSINGNTNVIDAAMRLDTSCFLADQLLVKADRASMATSLEARMPFLAHPVAEFALSLPASMKVNNLTTKYLLKKTLSPLLPENIVKRPKKGFGIPVAKWLKGDFKVLVDEFLEEGYIKRQGIFEWAYLNRLLTDHYEGRADRRKELWTLIMFQRWWHKFFGSTQSMDTGCSAENNLVLTASSAHPSGR
jgi:asparagine synthase (glutamine-hydrolysing)